MKLFRVDPNKGTRLTQRFAWFPTKIVYPTTASVWVWLEYYTAAIDPWGNVVSRCEL